MRRRKLRTARRGARRRWPRRLFFLLVGSTIVTLGVWSAIDLLQAARSLRDAENRIQDADRALVDARVGDAQRALDEAQEHLDDANRDLRMSPGIVLLRQIPMVGQNLTALDDSIELAATLVHGGRTILATSEELQDDSGDLAVELVEGSVPATSVATANTEIEALLVALRTRPELSSGLFVLPPVKEVQRRVDDEVAVQQDHLERLRRGLLVLENLVGVNDPKRTLISVANTAEMRGSGGMMLNFGILEAEGGRVEIDEFGRVGELPVASPPDPDSVGIPDDFQERWADFDYTRDWRNATLSADFTQDARTLLAMFQNATQLPADNVIQVDAHGLAALLSVTGPVEVDQLGTVTSENVVDLVLNEAYVLFPDRDTRTDVLGDVAEEAFRALVQGDYSSLSDMASALGDAVAGRHLMMYSADRAVQASLEFFGATGALPPADLTDYLHLTAQNMSGNKLDYYVDTSMVITGERQPGRLGELTVEISITNNAPPGATAPSYIFGPVGAGQVAGDYRSAVSLYMPIGATLVDASGDAFRQEPTVASEGHRPVVGYWIDVPAGGTHRTVVTLRMPPSPGDEDYSLTLVPSPRVRSTSASVDIATADGQRVSGDIILDSTWRLDRDGPVALPAYP